MKNLDKKLFVILSSACLAFVASCERDSAEDAGEWVDERAEDVRDGMHDAGEHMEEGWKDTTDGLKDATDGN